MPRKASIPSSGASRWAWPDITATGSFANGVLTRTGPHGGHAALHFAGSYASGFTIGSDGHGGTAITVHA